MFDREEFDAAKLSNAARQAADPELQSLVRDFVVQSDKFGYAYQWTWLGLPIIQMPADIVSVQEIIWRTRPTVIVETGIAWGGSIALYASLLELIGRGKVIAVDTVIPRKNVDAIKDYKFADRITLIEGSSVDPLVVSSIVAAIKSEDRVMVLLDSNHDHDHVLAELRSYAPLVTASQYLVVSDTIVETIPTQTHRPRSWGPGNNPLTAVRAYLAETDRFVIDEYFNAKLGPSFSPGGYLKCRG